MLKRAMARESRLRRAQKIAVACATLTLVAGQAACLAVPPPPLASQGPVRPTILDEGVSPQPGVPFVEWPDGGSFVIAVEAQDQPFYYDAFVDFDPNANSDPTEPSAPVLQPTLVPATTPDPVTIHVVLKQPDPRFCHTVEILVAHQFDQMLPHTPDSVGGDIVTWFYIPGGGDCPVIDAGMYENGEFFDAASP
jgi:hypothetical protein